MFQMNRDKSHMTKTNLVISKDGSYIFAVSGSSGDDACLFARSAPKFSKVKYISNSANDIFKNVSLTGLRACLEKLQYRRLTLELFQLAIKEIQANLANAGFQVLEVYGLDINDKLYGYDMGFNLMYKNVKIYVDFNLIHVDSSTRQIKNAINLVDGKLTTEIERKYGTFDLTNNLFSFEYPNVCPALISDLLGNVTNEQIHYLGNLNYIVTDIYSDMEDYSIRVIKYDSSLTTYLSGCYIDSKQIATETRRIGSEILKTVATSSAASAGLSNVGTAKILSADAIEKVGDVMLTETSPNGIIKSETEFERSRAKFLKMSCPSNDVQYSLAWNASNSVYQLGAAKVIDYDTLTTLIEDMIGQQPSISSNVQIHTVLTDDGGIAGFLSCGNKNVVYDKIAQISSNTELLEILIKDEILDSHIINNISIDSLSVKDTAEKFRQEIKNYESKVASMNFDSIQKAIKDIDLLVNKNFSVLSSLQASSDVLSARAATILKAVELILKFPMKTGYSAIEFGMLAEFFSIEVRSDGSSVISINEELHVPYMQETVVKQCGDWIVRKADPGRGYDNDILIGSVYNEMITDLKGNSLNATSKIYTISDRQTRGSGKCEQEVVPYRTTEERIVMRLREFLEKIKNMLDTLLNDEAMKANAQISKCIQTLTSVVKRYNSLRKPYQDKLIEYFGYQEKLFFYSHALAVLHDYYPYESDLAISSNVSYRINTQIDNLEDLGIKTYVDKEVINRELRGISVDDICCATTYTSYYSAKQLLMEAIIDYRAQMESYKSQYENKPDISKYEQRFPRPESMENPCSRNLENQEECDHSDHMDEYDLYVANQEAITQHEKKYDEYIESITKIINIEDSLHANINEIEQIEDINAETFSLVPNKFVIQDLILYCEDNCESRIRELLEEIKMRERALIAAYTENKEHIKSALQEYKIRHNGSIIKTINVENKSENETIDTILLSRETYDLELAIKLISKTETSLTIVIYVIRFIKKENYGVKLSHNISVGSQMYSIDTLLKHEYIYGVLPKHKTILDKIAYSMTYKTDASVEEVYRAIELNYGAAVANYYSSYVNKIEDKRSFFGSLVMAAYGRIDLFCTTMMAFQNMSLGVFLQDKGLDPGNVSSFVDVCRSLRL